ncbi:ADP-ribosylation factor-like protein 15 isoform X2 [Conger conger]|uniref:ADP-ribosylation factor-like protein 15 isoform X2 n=1 Tax=Conger conger TaxID=82655 RepID=UPI002A598CEF|nr:ADP-ribosylation factor-like protein 15 isoform X2 [Conger conger]
MLSDEQLECGEGEMKGAERCWMRVMRLTVFLSPTHACLWAWTALSVQSVLGSHRGVTHFPGADNIKKYWSRYYQGSQGVVFVLDSASSEEDLEVARAELHSALQHPQLCTLPFLILANHQDKPAARSVQEIKKYFELEPLARGKRWVLAGSTVDNMEAVKESFIQLIGLLEEKETDPARI